MKKSFFYVQMFAIVAILFAALFTLNSCEDEAVITDEIQSEEESETQTRGLFDPKLDTNKVYQTIDGFGFTQEEENTWISKEPYRTEIMNLLFDKEKGAGFSILRHKVGAGYSKPTIQPEEGVWNYEADEREMWYLKKAMEYGIDKIFGTVWTPPYWMKTNNQLTKGGRLKKEHYQSFAEYLTKYVRIYQQRGIPIWGISPANEPEYAADWDSCLWSGADFRNFIVNYWGPELKKQGVNIRIILGEMAWWNELKSIATLEVPQGSQLVDVVATHHYMNMPTPMLFAKKHNKPVWVTETCETTDPFNTTIGNGLWWALRVHTCLTAGEASAFLYWRGAHATNSNQTLIRITYENPYYVVSKRFYAIAQYSRFIRPGFVRIGINETPALGIVMSAYKNPETGQIVVVAVNINNWSKTLNLQLNGAIPQSMQSYVTDENRNIEKGVQVVVNGNAATLTLSPKSITTFVSQE